MIQSLFLLSSTGQVLIERHFRGIVTSRQICDTFWQQAAVSINHHGGVSSSNTATQLYDTVPPVMEVPSPESGTLYVVSILRDGLSYLAVCPAEVSPLTVLELLHRIADTFGVYFGLPADESAIKDNFSTVYQLLEEMIDYGWPLTTEGNALQAMIRPPSIMSKLLLSSSNVIADELPSGTVSNMPWRTAGVTYTQNEIYMDITEQVDAIVDARSGTVISSDVSGSILCQSHLSGVPDLLLTFSDPSLMDDVSFHPCVRYARFEKDNVVSFVPPDGNFELMRYRIRPELIRSHLTAPPVYCHAQWSLNNSADNNTSINNTSSNNDALEQTGRLVLNAGVTSLGSLVFSSSATNRNQVEDVTVTIPFPKHATKSTSDFRVNMGTVQYDEAAKIAKWNLGKVDAHQKASFSCRFVVALKETTHQKQIRRRQQLQEQQITLLKPKIGNISTSGGGGAARARRGRRTTDRTRNNNSHNAHNNSHWSPPTLSLGWKIPLASVSGLSVSGLSVTGEAYRPYKGVRNITKSGLFQVRSS